MEYISAFCSSSISELKARTVFKLGRSFSLSIESSLIDN